MAKYLCESSSEFLEILHTCRGHGARKFFQKKMNRSFPYFEGGGGEGETLTTHISPVGGPGTPQIFLVVEHHEPYLSSKSCAPPVMVGVAGGGNIFRENFFVHLGAPLGRVPDPKCCKN